MLKCQCCGTAAARQLQGAEGMPWLARQSCRGNVQWHCQKALLLWSETEFSYHCVIKLHLSDSQITICTGLMRDSPLLCVLQWERNTRNQLWNSQSPLLSQLRVKPVLDCFESWCVQLNEEGAVEQSGIQMWVFILWSEGLTVIGAAWGFEQREVWIGRVAVSAGMGHPEHWAELTVCCSSPPFIALLSNAVLLEQKMS